MSQRFSEKNKDCARFDFAELRVFVYANIF